MKKYFNFLFNRITQSILGLVAINLLIWEIGPIIAVNGNYVLESITSRIVAIVLITTLYFGKIIWERYKAKRMNDQLSDGISRQESNQTASIDKISVEKINLLNDRFEKAINKLKNTGSNSSSGLFAGLFSTLNRQYLYEHPWYIFIGAPQSGKTTALLNSGLKFSFSDKNGVSVSGNEGTKNCDWFFTDEAVFIDTAGRYTMQHEGHQATDNAEWNGFLKLLTESREQRPINGIIVTISIEDLLQKSETEIKAQTESIRDRIKELYTKLSIRFPIYVFVTKIDLLTGFLPFFNKLKKEEQSQVWGITFPFQENLDNPPLKEFPAEFSLLEQRLNDRLVDYLQDEKDIQSRALLYGFPQQFSALKEKLQNFLEQVFSDTDQPLLRGIYFTSGIQPGNSIDRVLLISANAIGLDPKLLNPDKQSKRSFFLTRLIKDVVLTESEIAGINLNWERQRRLIYRGAWALIILLTIGLISGWAISYRNNQTYIQNVEEKLLLVTENIQKISTENTKIIDFFSTLRSVHELTAIPVNDGNASPFMGLGLSQSEKLTEKSPLQNLLKGKFLPKLVARIEEILRNPDSRNSELFYDALKAYIMLDQNASKGNFDPVFLKAFIMRDWEINLPQEFIQEQRKALESYLDTLFSLENFSSRISINMQLVNKARTIAQQIPIEQRIYSHIKQQAKDSDTPDFTIINSIGASSLNIFERSSGTPLSEGVSGFFTYNGYYNYFLENVEIVTAKLIKEETWVLGRPEKNSNASSAQIENVRRLYLKEYAQIWEEFIRDIKLINTTNLQRNIDLTKSLSANNSLLPALLHAIVDEVTLVNNEARRDNQGKYVSGSTGNISKLKAQILGQGNTTTPATAPISRPESIVDERFKELRRLVQPVGSGQSAPINAILTQIEGLYLFLVAIEEAQRAGIFSHDSKVPSEIEANAQRLPEPLRSMFSTLSKTTKDQTQELRLKNINQLLRTSITDFCHQAISGRYPFTKTSKFDVTYDDFSNLFAPGGRFDEFFHNELSRYVDVSKPQWSFRHYESNADTKSSGDLQEFRRAKAVRDTFFRNNSQTPSINFTLKPLAMDSAISQFSLDIDGQVIAYSGGTLPRPMSIKWPGPLGGTQIQLQISVSDQDITASQIYEGPWAVFRMFDNAQINPSLKQPEKFTAIFNVDGKRAEFEVITSSVQNPFRLKELEQFNCPSIL